jgi:hypothetical protein
VLTIFFSFVMTTFIDSLLSLYLRFPEGMI